MKTTPEIEAIEAEELDERKCKYCFFFEASMVVDGYGWCDLLSSDSACDTCCDKFKHFEDGGK